MRAMALRIARLHSRALIRVAGADWRPFLHNLLTHDMLGLAPGELRFGGLLTPQGRILHDLFVHAGDDDALIDVAAEGRDDFVKRLRLYRLRAKLDIEPTDGGVWAAFGGEPEPAWPTDPRLPKLGSRTTGDMPAEAETASEDDYRAFQLSLGVPDPARDRTDSTYPIEANWDLLNGVDFQKGCFIGQETTSRMKRRGVIKTRTLPLTFDGLPPRFGAEVLAGDLRAGEVLSGVQNSAMAVLRLDRIGSVDLTSEGRPVRVSWPGWMPRP